MFYPSNERATLSNFQVFPEDYFTGMDVSVYLGETPIEEIVSLNFALSENVQPVYGFNSYCWDAVARGSRLVQGNFRINFVESDYLHKIIMGNSKASRSEQSYATALAARSSNANNAVSAIGGPATINAIKTAAANLTKEELLALAKNYQPTVWKTNQQKSDMGHTFFHNNQNGFNIVILYGSVLQPLTKSMMKNNSHIPPITKMMVKNVQLTGCQQVMAPDGNLIYEDYQFIARDLEKSPR